MNGLFDKSLLQSVICIKDNKLYVYKVEENPYFLEEDYSLIRCFLVREGGEPDYSKAIDIYGKDLVSEFCDLKFCRIIKSAFTM